MGMTEKAVFRKQAGSLNVRMSRAWGPLDTKNWTRLAYFDEPVIPKKGPIPLYSPERTRGLSVVF